MVGHHEERKEYAKPTSCGAGGWWTRLSNLFTSKAKKDKKRRIEEATLGYHPMPDEETNDRRACAAAMHGTEGMMADTEGTMAETQHVESIFSRPNTPPRARVA